MPAINGTLEQLEDLLQAAEQGDANAQCALGMMYSTGEGVSLNLGIAIQWTRMAAEKGNPAAQFNLGYIYENGNGVTKDSEKAAWWYQRAAVQGLAPAQNSLGTIYLEGRGVPVDERVGLYWLEKAAKAGYAPAQYNLGVLYAKGWGVAKDAIRAEVCFQKASDKGFTSAQATADDTTDSETVLFSVAEIAAALGWAPDRVAAAMAGINPDSDPNANPSEQDATPAWKFERLPAEIVKALEECAARLEAGDAARVVAPPAEAPLEPAPAANIVEHNGGNEFYDDLAYPGCTANEAVTAAASAPAIDKAGEKADYQQQAAAIPKSRFARFLAALPFPVAPGDVTEKIRILIVGSAVLVLIAFGLLTRTPPRTARNSAAVPQSAGDGSSTANAAGQESGDSSNSDAAPILTVAAVGHLSLAAIRIAIPNPSGSITYLPGNDPIAIRYLACRRAEHSTTTYNTQPGVSVLASAQRISSDEINLIPALSRQTRP